MTANFVALDVETGDYEIDEDDYAAVARLRSENRRRCLVDAGGSPTTYRMGMIR